MSSFFSGSNVADCGSINPMTSLFKQFGQDRSLQQDFYHFEKLASSSQASFRTRNLTKNGDSLLDEEFFKNELMRADQSDMLRNEVNLICQQQQINDWTTEFMHFKQQNSSLFKNHRMSIQKDNNHWLQDFEQFQPTPAPLKQTFTRMASPINWEQEFLAAQTSSILECREQSNRAKIVSADSSYVDHTIELRSPHAHSQAHSSPSYDAHDLKIDGPFNENVEEGNKIQNNAEQSHLDSEYHYSNNGKYVFQPQNPYLNDIQAAEQSSQNNLADYILALEAKAQFDPSDANVWKQLGLCQQENERDEAAIAALQNATHLNPNLLDVWLALAVSFANKHCFSDAYDVLEQWIQHHEQYKTLSAPTSANRHTSITQLFLEAARSSPGEDMDGDVQVGLGILFTISEEYEKAVDCFRAAVRRRPQDYMLWNKLGASLANSGNINDAIDAYFYALELKPTYVRARYNLALGCISLRHEHEAAEHLLNALATREHSFENQVDTVSDNVWGTLRMVMSNMGRHDLIIQCNNQNLSAFRADFEFNS